MLRDRQTAEDIVQEVLLKVYEKKVRIDPRAKFSTWLYRVTVNLCLDRLRMKKRGTRSLEEVGHESDAPNFMTASPEGEMMAEEMRSAVQHAVDQLPDKLRFPILLYQFQELPYAEIATLLEISKKAVERRLHRAKFLLHKQLSAYHLS